MSAAEIVHESTALRSLERRTQALPLDAQMVECIDLLQSPEIVVDQLLTSVEQIRETACPRRGVSLESDDDPTREGFFYPSRELFVQGDGCSFTCLATSLQFREDEPARSVEVAPKTGDAEEEEEESEGPPSIGLIDYAAVTCESRPFPVLGFTQTAESESAFPILLRGLANLIELTRPRRFDLLDREVYRGLLGPAPAFDLALVLWDEEEDVESHRPLCELARDLAEVLKATLGAEPRFPPILNDVVCLRMNPKRFDGRLRFVWRV